jgi:hypothetical protein
MKTKIIILPVIATFFCSTYVRSQVTTGSNTAGPGAEYVGWNTSGTSKDLDITNNHANQDINFTTNDGTTTAIRVTLQDDGNLGIGDAAPGRLLELGTGDLNLTNGAGHHQAALGVLSFFP